MYGDVNIEPEDTITEQVAESFEEIDQYSVPNGVYPSTFNRDGWVDFGKTIYEGGGIEAKKEGIINLKQGQKLEQAFQYQTGNLVIYDDDGDVIEERRVGAVIDEDGVVTVLGDLAVDGLLDPEDEDIDWNLALIEEESSDFGGELLVEGDAHIDGALTVGERNVMETIDGVDQKVDEEVETRSSLIREEDDKILIGGNTLVLEDLIEEIAEPVIDPDTGEQMIDPDTGEPVYEISEEKIGQMIYAENEDGEAVFIDTGDSDLLVGGRSVMGTIDEEVETRSSLIREEDDKILIGGNTLVLEDVMEEIAEPVIDPDTGEQMIDPDTGEPVYEISEEKVGQMIYAENEDGEAVYLDTGDSDLLVGGQSVMGMIDEEVETRSSLVKRNEIELEDDQPAFREVVVGEEEDDVIVMNTDTEVFGTLYVHDHAAVDGTLFVEEDIIVGDQSVSQVMQDHDSRISRNASMIAANRRDIEQNRRDIEENRSRIEENRRGIAMVAAMSNAVVQPGNTMAMDINVARFKSETGLSLSYAYRINEQTQFNIAGASTTGFHEGAFRAGMSFQW